MFRAGRTSNLFAIAIAAAASLLVVGCGSDKSPSASNTPRSTTTADPAIAKVAAFTCPSPATNAGGTAVATGRRLKVVTTVAPITSIVANVAGDKADVEGVIPEGEDSHTYEPKPSVAIVLGKADIVFVNGLKLEDPTKELAAANVKKGAEVVEMGTLTISPEQFLFDFSFPRADGKPNPHLWTNPPMAACYARIAESAMAKADPANAGSYKANADAFVQKIGDLDQRFTDASAGMPSKNRELLTYHDAYAYFAAHYGWKILGAIQISSFEEPTPKEVGALIAQVKAEGVPAIFGSEVFPSPVLAQIGKEAGVKYVDQLRDDDLPGAPGDANHSFLGLMKFDFVTMIGALGGDTAMLKDFDATDVAPDKARYPQ